MAPPPTVTVKEGDSLWRIAQDLGVSWDDLRKANADIAADVIQPGTVLRVPQPPPLDPPEAVEVGDGDSLWTIGQRWGVDWQQLKRANGLEDDVILPGDVLRIPKGEGTGGEGGLGGWVQRAARRIAGQRTKPVTVRDGDTAWDIAHRFGITVTKLQALNHGLSLDAIFPGDVVLVPHSALDRERCFLGLAPRMGPLQRADPDNPASPFVLAGSLRNSDEAIARMRQRHRKLLNGIRHVESSFLMPAPIGDDGFSIGPLQISKEYHMDAWWLEQLDAAHYARVDEVEHAEATAIKYWLRYCPWALDFGDYQTLARIHNGGPSFYENLKTTNYWRRVQGGLRKYGYRERPKFYDFLHEPTSPDRHAQRLRLEAPIFGLLLSPLLRRSANKAEPQQS